MGTKVHHHMIETPFKHIDGTIPEHLSLKHRKASPSEKYGHCAQESNQSGKAATVTSQLGI